MSQLKQTVVSRMYYSTCSTVFTAQNLEIFSQWLLGMFAREKVNFVKSEKKRRIRIHRTLSSITFPFFQASENRLPIFFEGFLGSILDLFTEKLIAPVGTQKIRYAKMSKRHERTANYYWNEQSDRNQQFHPQALPNIMILFNNYARANNDFTDSILKSIELHCHAYSITIHRSFIWMVNLHLLQTQNYIQSRILTQKDFIYRRLS